MTYKAFLQTKTGEVEGIIDVEEHNWKKGRYFYSFETIGMKSVVKVRMQHLESEAAALAHFEKHFGRIERENG